MLGQTQTQNTPLQRANLNKEVRQLSESYTKVSRRAISLEIVIIVRFCVSVELNGKPCQFTVQNFIKIALIFKNNGISRSTLKIGALTKLCLFFPVVCFICVFVQTLLEQLYSDKGLYSA